MNDDSNNELITGNLNKCRNSLKTSTFKQNQFSTTMHCYGDFTGVNNVQYFVCNTRVDNQIIIQIRTENLTLKSVILIFKNIF